MSYLPEFTVKDFDKALAEGPYAWPGGYPRYFLMDDGDSLSFSSAQANAEQIRVAIADHDNNGWRAVAVDVNWEDAEMHCAHSGERIPSAYGEKE